MNAFEVIFALTVVRLVLPLGLLLLVGEWARSRQHARLHPGR